MKTVKQIAIEQGVSKQTIHRIVRKRSLETFLDGNKVMLDDAAEAAIIEELQNRQPAPDIPADDAADDSGRVENVPERSRTFPDDSPDEGRTVPDPVELLLSQVEELRADKEQLISQLEEKQRTIDGLISQLDNVTAALKAAQTLHGIEKQQKVIEVKAAAAAEDPTPARSERRASSEGRSPAPAPARSGTQRPRTKNKLSDIMRKLFK